MTKLFTMLIILTASFVPAFADVIFTLGDHPQPKEENVLFQTDQTASSVYGYTSQTDVPVNIDGSWLHVNSGQSDIDVLRVNNWDSLAMIIHLPGYTFGDIILNPFNPSTNDSLTVNVFGYTSGVGYTSGSFTWGTADGNNFLTITTTGGTRMEVLYLYGSFEDLRQLRVSDVALPTPEPSTLALLGSGFLGVGGILRRKA